jgi:hypothetical protein
MGGNTFSCHKIAAFGAPTSLAPGPFSLTITNIDSQKAALLWSTNANGYYLEATPSLSLPAWSFVTNRPAVSNQQFVVTVSHTNSARFYRLHY